MPKDKDSWKDDPDYQNLAHPVDPRGLTAEQEAAENRKAAAASAKESRQEAKAEAAKASEAQSGETGPAK